MTIEKQNQTATGSQNAELTVNDLNERGRDFLRGWLWNSARLFATHPMDEEKACLAGIASNPTLRSRFAR